MGDEMLTGVCELAFEVAKEGGAPSAMKNYLYLAQRPPRAYSVAQRALEEDPGFRGRVAARASIDNVGEAGYLWLHRPEGWQQRVASLEAGGAPIVDEHRSVTPLAERPPMPAPPETLPPASSSPTGPPLVSPSPSSAPSNPAPSPSRRGDAIEDELADLRSLVDRLADERRNVRSSVSELEVELEQRRAENEQMASQLSTLRSKLNTVQSAEATVLLERDRSLARVTELEAEVAKLRTEVERLTAAADGSAAEHEAALTDLAAVGGERDSLRSELQALRTAHQQTVADLDEARAQRERLHQIEAERERLQGELDAVVTDRNALSGQFNEVRGERDALLAERDALSAERDALSAERDDLRTRFERTSAERDEFRRERDDLATANAGVADRLAEVDQLRVDNTELAKRVSVAEQARIDLERQLEEVSEKWQSAARQLSVFEGMSGQLDDAVVERKVIEDRLRQANSTLAELHRRIGTSHDHIRDELTSIESAFGDVDDLRETPLDGADESSVSPPSGARPSTEVDVSSSQQSDEPVMENLAVDIVRDAQAPSFDEPVEMDDVPKDSFGSSTESFGGSTESFGGSTESFGSSTESFGSSTESFGERAESFGSSTESFGSSTESMADADAVDDEGDFDPSGFELDPSALGGRTIGEMFGGGDDAINGQPAVDADASPVPAEPSSRPDRRQLIIPTELSQIAAAQRVVATPDVILLVDGDGVATLGWPHLDVASRRAALVGYLGTLTAETGAAADVVFERPVGDEASLPVSRAVRVRIADEPVAESSLFGSIVDGYPQEWPIAMVTNESRLVDEADDLQVSVLSNDQLLDLFLGLSSDG